MLFRRINRSDPEKVFVVVMNGYSTASLQNGYVVEWDFTTLVDGLGVTQPTATTVSLGNAAAGVAVETIAHNAYGLVQVYGYHAAVHARACTTATSIEHIELGGPIMSNKAGGVWCAENTLRAATGVNYKPMGFAMTIWSSWTSTTIKAFIKCL